VTAAALDQDELTLLGRVLDALLREDFLRMRTAGRIVVRPDGDWLRFPLGTAAAEIPVRPGRFLCRHEVREPLLCVAGQEHRGLADVFDALRPAVDPRDRTGFDDFRQECAVALAAARGQRTHRSAVLDRLPSAGPGPLAGLRYDTLAAFEEHPVHPTGRARHGLTEPELVRYAPEFAPRFALRWLHVPADALDRHGDLPSWWPSDGDRVAVPVHPLTAARLAAEIRAATGFDCAATFSAVEVAPTLSMRTVLVCADPAVHVKLPVPTSTLGRRNRRGMRPGTLSDGAITERLLRAVLSREPRFAERILLADEQTYGRTGHDYLGFLVRRHPEALSGSEIVCAAALTAAGPDGRPVLADLADRYFDGDPLALLDRYLELLFDWQLTLLHHGIALESHQQNISLLLDVVAGLPRLRLLIRDNDGPRLHTGRLHRTLGPAALAAAGLDRIDDRRMLVDRVEPLLDMITTITVHLCAAAPVFRLPGEQSSAGLDLVRARQTEGASASGRAWWGSWRR
jgi:siderophore synthetase component